MGAWKNAKLLTDDLDQAARTFDDRGTLEHCEKLIERARRDDQPFPLEEARRALEILRRWRRFALMERLADAFIQGGQGGPRIRRLYAQSLLDQGRLSSAISVLEDLLAQTAKGSAENAEARGLLGRAYKQMYVDGHGESRARGGKILEAAIRSYLDVFEKAPARYAWHGVNAAALLRRAEQDGVRLRRLPRPGELCERVLSIAKRADARLPLRPAAEKEARARPAPSRDTDVAAARRWNSATALEAAVGLQSHEEAHVWLERYLSGGGHSAFEVASTHRQFVEVWQLAPTSGLGAEILPVMETKLLQLTGAGINVQPSDVRGRAMSLERVLGSVGYVNIGWYRRGLERCASVARIERANDAFGGFGTGFLVAGRDLGGPLGAQAYVLTNAHVVSAKDVRGALRPNEARVAFQAHPTAGNKRWGVRSVLRESPPEELDFAILELDGAVDDGAPPIPLAAARPPLGGAPRVYVIGHPKGGGLSLSLNDNALLDYDERLLHYRAPTDPGSSGSPVFNEDWELLAIHHSGGDDMPKLNGKPGTYAANEGIWIQAVRKAIA